MVNGGRKCNAFNLQKRFGEVTKLFIRFIIELITIIFKVFMLKAISECIHILKPNRIIGAQKVEHTLWSFS